MYRTCIAQKILRHRDSSLRRSIAFNFVIRDQRAIPRLRICHVRSIRDLENIDTQFRYLSIVINKLN